MSLGTAHHVCIEEPALGYSDHTSSSWWGTRVEIARAPGSTSGERLWAAGELFAAAVSLATLFAVVGVLIASRWVVVPWFLKGWPMDLLLSAAVGYGTNYVAVQMLFWPREPARWAPLKWVWRQGLIPAKQKEVAEIVGAEVAERLLTPEAIVDELARLIERALEDRATVERLQQGLQPLLERELPELFRRFLPETMAALRRALEENVSADELKRLLLEVLEEWFEDEANRTALASFLLDLVRQQSHDLTKLLKSTLKRYSKTSSVRSLAIGAGIATNIVEWDDFEIALKRQLATEKSRTWANLLVTRFGHEVRTFAERVVKTEWIDALKKKAGDVTLESVERTSGDKLVAQLVVFVGSPAFRRVVLDELLPRARPKLTTWLKEGHLSPILEQFDVKGRVAAAAEALDVAELEDMANRVGAYHLAAIQVLGWVLGLAVGVLSALLRLVG